MKPELIEKTKAAFDLSAADWEVLPVWMQRKLAKQRPHVLIEVSGGVVHRVMANCEAEVELIDFDTFEADDFSGRKEKAAEKRIAKLEKTKGWREVL